MNLSSLQTYKQVDSWKEGDQLEKAEIVGKEETHEKDLLHLSTHLLVIDADNRILSRKRKPDDFRYANLWTSTLGTHVLTGSDYLSTLKELSPIQKGLEYIGEFRVHDAFENEINGLYVMRVDENELPTEFLSDKKFFSKDELTHLIKENQTTPHLSGGFDLLQKKFFRE